MNSIWKISKPEFPLSASCGTERALPKKAAKDRLFIPLVFYLAASFITMLRKMIYVFLVISGMITVANGL